MVCVVLDVVGLQDVAVKAKIIKAIISLFEAQGLKISLCAPTGRAAKRLSDLSDRPAKTIHRLLEVMPGSKDNLRFARNQDNPLQCQVLIVDEFSIIFTTGHCLKLNYLRHGDNKCASS